MQIANQIHVACSISFDVGSNSRQYSFLDYESFYNFNSQSIKEMPCPVATNLFQFPSAPTKLTRILVSEQNANELLNFSYNMPGILF